MIRSAHRLLSIVETCRRLKIQVREYLAAVLPGLANSSIQRLPELTPTIELLGERRAEWVLADKGYDSRAILDHIEAMGAVAVVPSKSNRKQQRTHDKELYRKRDRIERCFSRLKHFRRCATRYEKIKQNFKALVALACSWLHLQLYVDTA